MEDQDGDFYLDVEEGMIVSPDDAEVDVDIDNEERFIMLPEWESSDGFRLMEGFALSLHNPTVRDRLSAALNRGRGVFRAFKDTLSEYPEVEKHWFAYKDREMKREVIRWYNALRESWGLEQIGQEPEDIEDIAQEDFSFRDGNAADCAAAEQLHQRCVDDAEHPVELAPWVFPGDLCLVAENAANEFSGYISAHYENRRAARYEHGGAALHIHALEVKPEYRGLGLGKTLLELLLFQADEMDIAVTGIDLPAEYGNFSRVLSREGFQPLVTRYWRKAI